jgi:hypothetical protein
MQRGTVVIQREAQTRLSLLPDRPETREALGPWRAGHLSELRAGALSRCRTATRGGQLAVAPCTASPR